MRITQRKPSKLRRAILSVVPAMAAIGLVITPSIAGALAPGDMVSYTPVPFVASEWTADRTFPTGGISVGDFAGRDGVLSMGIVGAQQSSSSWYRYEGVQRDISGATAVKADLYVDSAWPSQVNAGMWGVGVDSTNAVSAYPILAFVKDTGYTGWRTFDDQNGGWINLPTAPFHNGWNTVAMTFNSVTTTFDLSINGASVGSSVATGSVGLSAVILDNYNFGTDYTVHWSHLATGVVMAGPENKSACKDDGWKSYQNFRNQGDCVSYVNHHDGVGNDDAVVQTKKHEK